MGVDEIYLGKKKKKKKFVTVVSNLETREPLWFGAERKKEMLDEFFRSQLSRKQRQGIVVETICGNHGRGIDLGYHRESGSLQLLLGVKLGLTI
jgi:hypothetical protein